MTPQPFFALSAAEMNRELQQLGLEPFRLKQIREWVLGKQVFDIKAMTNLSTRVRALFEERFSGVLPVVDNRLVDRDGTQKILFSLADEEKVECVALPDEKSLTFCLSTQIGCTMACGFCRTGQEGFRRNLAAHEIILEYLMLVRAMKRKPDNIVFMGMGEPFLNRKEVFAAIDDLCDPKGIHLGSRRLTVSTVGIPTGIAALAQRPGEVNLAVSLHTVDQEVRNLLIPAGKGYSLTKLWSAVESYIALTGRRVTFEVVLLDGVNDDLADAMNLAAWCEGLLCHVNLIGFHPFPGTSFRPSSEVKVREFRKVVKKAGIPITIRKSRGENILAACGQLAGK
jgi:23S rRNA (adenine2503-C2)-methyltransferase